MKVFFLETTKFYFIGIYAPKRKYNKNFISKIEFGDQNEFFDALFSHFYGGGFLDFLDFFGVFLGFFSIFLEFFLNFFFQILIFDPKRIFFIFCSMKSRKCHEMNMGVCCRERMLTTLMYQINGGIK